MKKILCITLLLLTACEHTVWHKAGATQYQFENDMAKCRMYGAHVPAQPEKQAPAYGDPTGPGVAMENMGIQLGNVANRMAYFDNCMMSMGYRKMAQ